MKLCSQRPRLDARELGADCNRCPLNAQLPVAPTRNPHPRLIVVGEGPGKTEEVQGRPFVGESGRLLDRILEQQGIPRSRLHITNALLCRAPTSISNDDWKKALECCRPRLERELADVACDQVLTLGKRALQALTGRPMIVDWMGAPLHGTVWRGDKDLKLKPGDAIPEAKTKRKRSPRQGHVESDQHTSQKRGSSRRAVQRSTEQPPEPSADADDSGGVTDFRHLRIMPALHPAHCLRAPEWVPVLQIHIGRAWRMALGALPEWRWPTIYTNVWPEKPSISLQPGVIVSEEACIAELERMLKRSAEPGYHIGLDVETIGSDIFEAELLNVGFADGEAAVSIDWRAASERLKELCRLLILALCGKDMHNGQFDDLILSNRGMPVGNFDHDTMLAFATVWPRLTKSLSTASCIEFWMERWKTIFRAGSDDAGAARFARADPYERAVYNAKDSSAQWHLRKRMEERLSRDETAAKLFAEYMALNVIATRMKRDGFLVDRSKFARHRKILMRRRRDARRELVKFAEHVGLTHVRTPKGELKPFNPGSNLHVIELLVGKLGVVPRVRSKKPPFRPSFTEPVLLDLIALGTPQQQYVARRLLKFRRAGKLVKTYIDGLPIGADGRVHSNWNPSGAKTGRWASGGPNLQNVPEALRDIFIASPGCKIVAVDFKQLEAYILGLLCGDPKLLELLKGDIHAATARMVFAPLLEAEGRDITDDERQDVKTPRYAVHYGAKIETVWKTMVVDRPDIAMSTVERLVNGIRKMHPDMLRWQQQQLIAAMRNDYIIAPISGRKYRFYGQVEPSKVYNLPIQMTAADLMNDVIRRVAARLAKLGSRYKILAQVHDEIVCEGPNPKLLARILKEECERPIKLGDVIVSFPVDVWVGPSWGETEKYEEKKAA